MFLGKSISAAVMTHEISVDTVTGRIALRQFKGPGVSGRIPVITLCEAIDVPIDFHVHCREMLPAGRAILLTVTSACGARELSPRLEVRKTFGVPAIGKVNVVTQACCICVAIDHGKAQAGISKRILLRIWVRAIRFRERESVRRGGFATRSLTCRTRELDRLRDALTRVSSQVDTSAL